MTVKHDDFRPKQRSILGNSTTLSHNICHTIATAIPLMVRGQVQQMDNWVYDVELSCRLKMVKTQIVVKKKHSLFVAVPLECMCCPYTQKSEGTSSATF